MEIYYYHRTGFTDEMRMIITFDYLPYVTLKYKIVIFILFIFNNIYYYYFLVTLIYNQMIFAH